MKTFYYVRVSTHEQTTQNQIQAISEKHKAADAVFDDSGVSGSTPAMDRPAFSEMMNKVQEGDQVIVYSLSRVGRSALDTLNIIELFKQRGVALVSHTEGFDVTSKMGKFVVTILAGVAEMERETLIERVNAGIKRAQAEGKHCGRAVSSEGAKAREMLAAGDSVADVMRATGLSKAMVYRLKKAA